MNLKAKQAIDKYIGKTAVAISLLLVRGLGLLLKRNHSLNEAPKHILVIKMLGIGSILMAADSIYSLKKRYPDAKLILLSSKGIAPGIEPLGLFHEVWVIQDNSFFTMIKSGISTLIKSWKLRNLWVLDLEVYSVMTTLFSTYTLALNRFGFQLNKVHFRNYLNTHNVYFNQFITVNQNYHQLVMAMGVKKVEQVVFTLPQTPNPFPEKCIILNNTSSELGDGVRSLTETQFVTLIKHLRKSTKYHLLINGAPSDKESNQQFVNKHFLGDPSVHNIAGRFSLKEFYALLSQHNIAMFTIDSAPFHMAVKFGVPSLSFWGPINPAQRLKFEDYTLHDYYYLNKECSPCIHLSDVLPCGGNNICMKDMDIAMILEKADKLIAMAERNHPA